MAGKYRLGIDVGGTFTDAMIINEETCEIRIGKVPSTPKDPYTSSVETWTNLNEDFCALSKSL